jgi:hypothetical protein
MLPQSPRQHSQSPPDEPGHAPGFVFLGQHHHQRQADRQAGEAEQVEVEGVAFHAGDLQVTDSIVGRPGGGCLSD